MRKSLIKTIVSSLDCKVKRPPEKELMSLEGNNYNKAGSFVCHLENIRKGCLSIKKFRTKTYNKQQLSGKLILINGEYFRVCRK